MKKYQYQLIKYIHDHFTGEFINIGIVIYSPREKYLESKFTVRFARVKATFPQANTRYVDRVLKSVQKNIKTKAQELNELFTPSENLEDITKNILPKDDSSIQFSIVKQAIDIDLNAALNGLYIDLIDKYQQISSKNVSLTDNDVWQTKYKQYFEKLNIAQNLSKHILQTQNDAFTFEKAWKNGVWHCYQPLSFELQDKEAIKDKVYRWAGKLQEMQTASEKINITFLTSTSRNYKDLETFISEYLTMNQEEFQTSIIREGEAKQFAKTVKELMDEHIDN